MPSIIIKTIPKKHRRAFRKDNVIKSQVLFGYLCGCDIKRLKKQSKIMLVVSSKIHFPSCVTKQIILTSICDIIEISTSLSKFYFVGQRR